MDRLTRLTTDVPKDNVENALNLFYVKDGWAWIRGGGPAPDYADMPLHDFARMLVQPNIPDVELPEDNDALSDLMCDWLTYDPDSAEGIISLLYTAGWAFAELRHRLACYEDFHEQGRLVVLPCKVGDTVYRLITPKDAPAVICEKPIRTVGEAANLVGWLGKKRPLISVFASREEAERALEGGADNGRHPTRALHHPPDSEPWPF